MITAGLNGRLGNEMFQIAAATALAYENNDISQFDLEKTYGTIYRDNIYSKLIHGVFDTNYIEYVEKRFRYTKIEYQHSNDLTLKLFGYFQSDKYFRNYKYEIIDLFSNDLIINKLKNEYNNILKNSVSFHIRRTDYLSYPHIHPCSSPNYYINGVRHIENEKKIDNILVFSDDINYCKENFFDKRITYIEYLKDYEDMYLMSLCENNIIANSSFSWWGSYLNKNANKIVICPKLWFGLKSGYDSSDIYYENIIIM